MADLIITAANVTLYDQGTTVRLVQVGEAVTAGAVGYLSTGKYYLSDCTVQAKAKAEVIFLTAAALDGYAMAIFPGKEVNIGATVAVNTVYVLSVGGAIAPIADLAIGDYLVIIGAGTTTGRILFKTLESGVVTA